MSTIFCGLAVRLAIWAASAVTWMVAISSSLKALESEGQVKA